VFLCQKRLELSSEANGCKPLLAGAWRCWKDRVGELERHRNILRRCVSRMEHRAVRAALYKWRGATAQSRRGFTARLLARDFSGREVIENMHSTDVDSPPPHPCVYTSMSILPNGMSCSDLGSSLCSQ
jgi:hypothetical protein